MATALKILFFYGLWYFCAWAGKEGLHLWALSISLLAILVDFSVYRYPIGALRYLSFVLYLMVTGPAMDLSFKALGLFSWEGVFYPPSILAIWAFFAVYYPELFRVFRKKLGLSFLLGAIFGPLAYYSGHLIGSLHIHLEQTLYAGVFAICWGLYFVVSLWVYNLIEQSSLKSEDGLKRQALPD